MVELAGARPCVEVVAPADSASTAPGFMDFRGDSRTIFHGAAKLMSKSVLGGGICPVTKSLHTN